MDEARVDDATRAEVPIWAVETLVANAIDVLLFVSYFRCIIKIHSTYLVTSITDSIVTRVTARSKQSLRNSLESSILDCGSEAVLWVVTMLVVNMARNAEIIILARSAGNEVLLGEFLDAGITGTCCIVLLLGSNKSSL